MGGFVKPDYIMKPTIGRVVVYKTTESERDTMDKSNSCNVQEQLPATVVAVHGETCVNLNVQLDGQLNGNSIHWVLSSNMGKKEGEWTWPEITSADDEPKLPVEEGGKAPAKKGK